MEYNNLFQRKGSHQISRKVNMLLCSVALSVLGACSPEKNTSLEASSMDISSIADESELTRIGVKKVEFDKKIQAIKSKYGISVKIGEASDTLYATGEVTRGNDIKEKSPDHPRMNIITEFNSQKWERLVEVVTQIDKSFGVYEPEFLSVIKTVYIADTIDNAGGFAKAHPIPVCIACGNRSIVIPSAMQYGNIERVTHNEITHVLDLARSEQWPFEKINQNKNWVQVTQEPLGFSRNYGTKNREEDIATTGDAMMSYFIKDGGLYNLAERIKTDEVLARKVMFMTGVFYDKELGRFTKDFTLEEFRDFFGVSKLGELPFYARMRKEGQFNYKYWNKILITPSDKENR